MLKQISFRFFIIAVITIGFEACNFKTECTASSIDSLALIATHRFAPFRFLLFVCYCYLQPINTRRGGSEFPQSAARVYGLII
jgi:hypothetical protein